MVKDDEGWQRTVRDNDRQRWMTMDNDGNAPPSSLMDSIASPKKKIVEGKRIRTHTLAHTTSGVKGPTGAL